MIDSILGWLYDTVGEVGMYLLLLVAALAGSALFVAGCAATMSRINFPMQKAKIEQLRKDAAGVDPSQAEDVIGQVTAANQSIMEAQTCNRTWYCDFLVTDKWNGVALIAVPRKGD